MAAPPFDMKKYNIKRYIEPVMGECIFIFDNEIITRA
jgi:hypothetical protein